MTDLAEWLLACIAQDEADVELATPGGGARLSGDSRGYPIMYRGRVLAECEAKRRIVAEHRGEARECVTCVDEESFSEDSEGYREWYRTAKDYPCPTLRLLALPYADRPGYLEEWRP